MPQPETVPTNPNTITDKTQHILDAAYQLFLECGDSEFSIQKIADRAGIAKGTVYLYFHNKEELRRSLVAQKSRELFRAAINALYAAEVIGLEEQVIFIINYVVNLLAQNPMFLRLIAKDLSAGLFDQVYGNEELSDTANTTASQSYSSTTIGYNDTNSASNNSASNLLSTDNTGMLRAMLLAASQSGVRLRSPHVLLFMIVDLTGSACYHSILESRPLPIQDYKPYLFETIRNMLRAAVVR